MHVVWRSDSATRVTRLLRWLAVLSVGAGIAIPLLVWGTTTVLAAVDGLPGGIDLVIEREAGDARVADVLTARELIRKRTDARDASESGDA